VQACYGVSHGLEPSLGRWTKATNAGRAQGLIANGNLTVPTTRPTHAPTDTPYSCGVSARHRDGVPCRTLWDLGVLAPVSSPASNTGPVGTTEVSSKIRNMRASSHADQRRCENTR
jgi:hypothetical protein